MESVIHTLGITKTFYAQSIPFWIPGGLISGSVGQSEVLEPLSSQFCSLRAYQPSVSCTQTDVGAEGLEENLEGRALPTYNKCMHLFPYIWQVHAHFATADS